MRNMHLLNSLWRAEHRPVQKTSGFTQIGLKFAPTAFVRHGLLNDFFAT